MGVAIEARGLVKRYGDVVAVDAVDLDVEEGSFVGVIGPNGAGKTTLLELIEGIRKPDAGSVLIEGVPTWPRRVDMLPTIGVQLQASAFFERLTVREQVDVTADLYGVPHARSAEILDRVGLTEKAATLTEDLSGGQRQRLAIACALVHDPRIVFLDEPTAALDPQARRNLWDLLLSINAEGRTVVLTTHYMDEAEALCDQVAILDHGRILVTAPPATLVRNLDAPTRINLPETALSETEARGITKADTVRTEDGTMTLTTRDPQSVLADLAARGRLSGLQVRGATLEDVFLSLTGREYRA